MKAFFSATCSLAALSLTGCDMETPRELASASLAAFTQAAPNATAVGCQSRSARFPWGRMELRTWTPREAMQPINPSVSPGSAYGAPFSARLVQAYGADYGEARRSVTLELEDGCRRKFKTQSLSEADNSFLDSELAKHPTIPDPATYRIEYQPNGTTSPELVASGELNLLETPHFAFWYGNGTDQSYEFARDIARQGRTMQQVLQETAEWYERLWYINRDIVGAPMPFANSTDKRKINVFLCGTGRPNVGGDREGCGASAAEFIGISAWALAKGSGVITHEFGHVIQFYTGGFRGGNAGPIWETGANWNSAEVNPSINNAFYYFDNLENGPTWSVSRYANYPFMSFLFEQDRTRDLVFGVWKPGARQGAWSSLQKDYFPMVVEAGRVSGAYPEGFVSFANDMGWYGARLVTMDFQSQSLLRDAFRWTRDTHNMGHFYTPLVRDAADPTVYTSPNERPLMQWGTHLIPLSSNASTVKVTLTGRTTANSAAWRFSIVAVRGGDKASYSTLGRADGRGSGTISLGVPTDAKLYLAVTATPYRYESNGWQTLGEPVKGTKFPYSIKLEGAVPRVTDVRACDLESRSGTWGVNYTLNGNTDQPRPCNP